RSSFASPPRRESRFGSQRALPVSYIPAELQEDLHALSRQKLKEIQEQKKVISELQQENERMRASPADAAELQTMRRAIEELQSASEAHARQVQQQTAQQVAEVQR